MSSLLGEFDVAQEYFDQAGKKVIQSAWANMLAIVDYDQACSLIQAGVTDKSRILELLGAALAQFRLFGMSAWAQHASMKKEALSAGT